MKSSSNKTKTVNIPKDIFEKYVFQNGGKKEADLEFAGRVQTEMKGPTNAELEKGEWILDSQGLREVEGKTHEKGGVDLNLEEGTLILSNHLKLNKVLAKELSKEFEVKISSKDTFAKALGKVYDKIGLNDKSEEHAKLIAKMDKQADIKDDVTLNKNVEYLTNKLHEVEQEKAPLEDMSIDVFNTLFEAQEKDKPKDEVPTDTFQSGGTVQRSQYNVPTNVYGNRVSNQYELPTYAYQPDENGNYGSVDKSLASQEIARLFPSLYANNFAEGSATPTSAKEYQQAQQKYYYDLEGAAKRLYGEDSETYKNLVQQISQDGFTAEGVSDTVRGFDGKFGNYTSTRPNFSLEVLPEDIYRQMQSEGINTFGQLEAKYPDIYNEYIGSKQLSAPSDAWLGYVREPGEQTVTPTPNEVPTTQDNVDGNLPVGGAPNSNTGILAKPDMSQLPPTSQQGHLKTSRRYERADYIGIDPQSQLNELALMTSRASDSLDLMPAHQRAAVQANMLGTQLNQADRVMQSTQQYNNQVMNQVQNQNNQIQMAEENASAQDALNYEQRQFLAKAKTDNEYRDYFNSLQLQNHQNFMGIQNANKLNHLYNDFQLTDRGYEAVGPKYNFSFNGETITPEEHKAATEAISKKRKQKFGGRFGK